MRSISKEKSSWSPKQKCVRGLFAGGPFCYQSQQIFRDAGIRNHFNAPLELKYQLQDFNYSCEHTLLDMGADEFTLGKPHPMIDGTLRKQRILTESHNPRTTILLLPFILGYNASMDPVGELLDAIIEANQTVRKHARNLTVVASMCGTDVDPQDLNLQIKLLKKAGVIVFHSNAKPPPFVVNC